MYARSGAGRSALSAQVYCPNARRPPYRSTFRLIPSLDSGTLTAILGLKSLLLHSKMSHIEEHGSVDKFSSNACTTEELADQDVRTLKISSQDTVELRHSVLWPDMPRQHVVLPEDAHGMHFGVFLPHANHPVAVISLFRAPIPIGVLTEQHTRLDGSYPPMVGEDTVRFRKFACDPQYQGRGIGTQLLFYALSMARSELGVTVAWCDARRATQEWYAKRGFVPFGDTFFKGPVEYVRMKLDLDASLDVPRKPRTRVEDV